MLYEFMSINFNGTMLTMMEENHGLMGKKGFSSVHIAGQSSMGITHSNTTRMLMQSNELFSYCADGLTGSSMFSSPPLLSLTS